jgi:hypothetical protein
MRIAVVIVPTGNSDKLAALAKSVTRGLESQGHSVTMLNAVLDGELRLLSYEFVAVGSEPVSFTGKASPKVRQALGASGSLAGKRSLAFMPKPAFFPQRACLHLMAAMESQGMVVTDSAVFKNAEEALAFASAFRAERG